MLTHVTDVLPHSPTVAFGDGDITDIYLTLVDFKDAKDQLDECRLTRS